MLTDMIALTQDRHSQLLEEARQHALAEIAAGPRRPKGARRALRTTPVLAGRRSPIVLATVGVALATVSAGAIMLAGGRDGRATPAPRPVPAAAAEATQVAIADLIYEPGHSSGWHVHPGVHAVVVLSGTLTVLDQACTPHDYGPGQTYLGGREPHLARNEGLDAVALVVTYVPDPSASDSPGTPVGAPSGCPAT